MLYTVSVTLAAHLEWQFFTGGFVLLLLLLFLVISSKRFN